VLLRAISKVIKSLAQVKAYISEKHLGVYLRIKGADKNLLYGQITHHRQKFEERVGGELEFKESATWDSSISTVTASIKPIPPSVRTGLDNIDFCAMLS
jgi:hypothetical protein